MRGHKTYGVCGGTHRVYSLMSLVRLDDEFNILSDEVHAEAIKYLASVRDILLVTQFEDGHWPDGEAALDTPEDYDAYKDVVATGHHLEWCLASHFFQKTGARVFRQRANTFPTWL